MVDNLWSRLEGIFRDVFDDEALKITQRTTASDIAAWDSLTNINLITAVEGEFKIRFALGEIQELKNVGEMAALIEKKVEQRTKK